MATAEMCLNVRGEPVAATLVLNMRPRTRQRRLICHELALGLAEFSFVSLVAQHLRGITTQWLSRYRERLSQCCP